MYPNSTLLQLEGGHTTVVRLPIHEVADALTDARQRGLEFLYLQSPAHGDNGYVVDPSKVVALIRMESRGNLDEGSDEGSRSTSLTFR